MMEFLTAHWPWIALVLIPFVIGALNAIAKHYSNHTGLVKVIGVITEILGTLRSSDAPSGALGRLKWPLQDVPPRRKDVRVGRITSAIFIAMLAGCGTSFDGVLKQVSTGIHEAVLLSNRQLGSTCYKLAKNCADNGIKRDDCEPVGRCDKAWAALKEGTAMTDEALKLLQHAHDLMEGLK